MSTPHLSPVDNPDTDDIETTGRRLPAWATDPATWIATGAAMFTLTLAAAALWLLWLLVTSLISSIGHGAHAGADAVTRAGRWLTHGPIAHTITDPVHHYLDTHTAGLPATASQLWAAWLTATAVLFVASWMGLRSARVGWVLIGAVTTGMVWAGAPHTGRDLAAAVAIGAWALLSLLALSGLGRRTPAVVVRPRPRLVDDVDPRPAAPASV
ncbi:hypothetical protein ACNTMW_31015 [Planosporangium sp. 12N6]|uniref:hypothetical protein n=1 Tax=Planosporangium spinosum TaxID=3402278 RepID=UPI003CF95E80